MTTISANSEKCLQFNNPELAELFTKQYADDPLSYQSAMFSVLSGSGVLKKENPNVMALQFYAPIFMLLTLCDREPHRCSRAFGNVKCVG